MLGESRRRRVSLVHSHLGPADQSCISYLLGQCHLHTGMTHLTRHLINLWSCHITIWTLYTTLTTSPTTPHSFFMGSLFPLSSGHAVTSVYNTWAKFLLLCDSAPVSLLQKVYAFPTPLFTASLPSRVSSSFSFPM